MKKGLIVEQKRNKTLFMTSDGSFYKSHKVSGEIGEEMTFEPVEHNSLQFITQWFQSIAHAKPLFAAIIAFLFILPFYSWFGEEDVHAYVNIDINPSVELSLNEDFEVIDLHGLNHDGKTLIKQLDDWEGEPVKKVSTDILSLSNELGYIKEGHQVLLGISYINGLVNQDLLKTVSKEMETSNKSIEVAAFEVPKDMLKKAHEQKVSMNFVYASELIEKYENEQITQAKEDSAKQSVHNKIDEQHMKVIEKFIEQSKELPPGLKKKVEKAKETKQLDEPDDIDESQYNEKDNIKDTNHPSQKKNDNQKQKDRKDQTPPGQEKKDDDWTPPGKKKQEDDSTPPGKKKQDEEWTPPGKKKDDGDWSSPGKGKDKSNRGNKGSNQKEKSFTPPGLDERDEDHPGNGKGKPN